MSNSVVHTNGIGQAPETVLQGTMKNEAMYASSSECHDCKLPPHDSEVHVKLAMNGGVKNLVQVVKQNRLSEKIVYLFSVMTIVFLTYCVIVGHWLLPYYYTVSMPTLVIMRTVMYWKNKWQYFLLDFCYFVNTLWFVFIWAFPCEKHVFMVAFSLANGPLMWAVIFYRNSLVLHNIDKVTSAYIHLLPAFLSFGIRWYSEEMSLHWYTSFIPHSTEPSAIWFLLVPVSWFIVHTLFYVLLVSVILKPPEEYLDGYRYFSSKEGTWMFKALNFCGPKWRYLIFNVFNILFCLTTVSLTWIWYSYFLAHCIFIGFICIIVIWNGASYYLDIFAVAGDSN